jgi:hypothetical protein
MTNIAGTNIQKKLRYRETATNGPAKIILIYILCGFTIFTVYRFREGIVGLRGARKDSNIYFYVGPLPFWQARRARFGRRSTHPEMNRALTV